MLSCARTPYTQRGRLQIKGEFPMMLATTQNDITENQPTQQEVEEAVRTLIKWAGDDPTREGLKDTPVRVAKAFKEYFSGYTLNPQDYLQRTFQDICDYDEMVILRDIRFESHCEHHMAPIIGYAHIAYLPNKRVVGISKLARVVDIFAKRLQIQEKMTVQIADAIETVLKPHGVAVIMEATHECMSCRGVHKSSVTMITSCMKGLFREVNGYRKDILDLVRRHRGD